VSAWLSLTSRAKLVRGESVLVLGATEVTGELAIDVERIPLTEVENAWQRKAHGRRLAFIP